MTTRTPGRTAGVDNRRPTRSPFLLQRNTPIMRQNGPDRYKPGTSRRKGSLPSRNTGQIQMKPTWPARPGPPSSVSARARRGRGARPGRARPGPRCPALAAAVAGELAAPGPAVLGERAAPGLGRGTRPWPPRWPSSSSWPRVAGELAAVGASRPWCSAWPRPAWVVVPALAAAVGRRVGRGRRPPGVVPGREAKQTCIRGGQM